MAITFEQVCGAIEEILETQEKFTLQDVRAHLGNKGSMSTISKYAQQWRSNKFIVTKKDSQNHQPAPDSIMEAVTSVWQNMSHQSTQQLKEKQEELEKCCAQFEQNIMELNNQIQQEQQEKKELQQELGQLEQKLRNSEQEIFEKQKTIEILKEDKNQLILSYDKNQLSIENTIKNLETTFESKYQNLLAESEKKVAVLSDQISHLMNLNEEQRIESLKYQESLLREAQIHQVKKVTESLSLQALDKFNQLSQSHEKVSEMQDTLSKVLHKKVITHQWKCQWAFVSSESYNQINKEWKED